MKNVSLDSAGVIDFDEQLNRNQIATQSTVRRDYNVDYSFRKYIYTFIISINSFTYLTLKNKHFHIFHKN